MPTTRSRKTADDKAKAAAEAAAKEVLKKKAAAAAKHAEYLARRRVRDRENYRKKKEAASAKKAATSKQQKVKTMTLDLDQGDASNNSLALPDSGTGGRKGDIISVDDCTSPSKSNPNYSTDEKELIVRLGMTHNMTYSATYKGAKANKKRPLQQIADLLNKGYHNGCSVRTWKGVQAFINRKAAEFVDYQRKLAQCGRHVRGAGGDNAEDADDLDVPEFWHTVAPFWANVASGGIEQMKDFDSELYHQYDNMAAQVNADAAKSGSITPATMKKGYNKKTSSSSDLSDEDDSDMDSGTPSNSSQSLISKRSLNTQLKDMRKVNKARAAKSAIKRRACGSGSASQHASKKAKTKNTRHKSKRQSFVEKTFASLNELAVKLTNNLNSSAQDKGNQHSMPITSSAAITTPAASAAAPSPPNVLSTSAVGSTGAQSSSSASIDYEAKRAKAKQQMQMLEDAKIEYNLSDNEVKAHRARIIAEMLA